MMNEKIHNIAISTISLYINMIVTIAVTIFGTRLALNALGDDGYGTYMLVTNVVALFSFLTVVMASATQRYISYYIGAGRQDEINNIFYYSLVIHITIAVVLSIIIISIGIPAIKLWLDIPSRLQSDAIIVLFCMVGGIVFTVNSVPFEATMNAHEDIPAIAFINIIEAVCKLSAAATIIYIPHFRLPTYATLIMCSSIVAFILKTTYCRRKYQETHFNWHRINDWKLMKVLTSYAGWNLIGNGCSIIRYQGVAIILNKFFGLLYNSGYGISQQVNGFLLFFANSAVRPMRPHIIKSEGAGDHETMIRHCFSTSKITSLLLAGVTIPIYINMPFILKFWLNNPPSGSIEFCKGFLIITLIGQLTIGLQIALESVGKIKKQHLILGTMHLLPIVVSIILMMYNLPYVYIIYSIIVEECICVAIRTYIAKIDARIPARSYILEVLVPCTLTIAITYVASNYISDVAGTGFTKVIITSASSILLFTALAFTICLNKWERDKIYSLLRLRRSR